jgi:U3 small nucleolar RNA-associated protein 22
VECIHEQVTSTEVACSQIPQGEFVKAFKDVLVDHTGSVNVLAGWEKGDVDLVCCPLTLLSGTEITQLRYHARETLAMLEDTSLDRFDEVFLRDHTLGPVSCDEYIE